MPAFEIHVENPAEIKRNKKRARELHEPEIDRMIVEAENEAVATQRALASFGPEWAAVKGVPVPTAVPHRGHR